MQITINRKKGDPDATTGCLTASARKQQGGMLASVPVHDTSLIIALHEVREAGLIVGIVLAAI